MHQALYRKWRPQTFDDVCGQEHVTSILRYEMQNQAFSHAYLFCGSRGTGKTTCAKILAKAVNCLSPENGSPCGKCSSCRSIENGSATDVLEMDAASNNGVDDVRDIRDEVVYAPSLLRYRVYIIDEVHMLSNSAFNALLKTLEEPPAHVIFILATTELQKLPATIVSRCQRFDFRRISTEVLTARLCYIAQNEQITLAPEAARMLAKLAQGGMRDAISLMELCASSDANVTPQVVDRVIGLTGRDAMLAVVKAVFEKNYELLFSQVDEIVRSSKDLTVFWQDLIAIWRDMLVCKTTPNASRYLDLTDHEAEAMQALAALFSKETLIYHCRLLEQTLFSMQKSASVKRMVAEMALVRMCDEALDSSSEAILARISKLEDGFLTAPATPAVKAAPTTPPPAPKMTEATAAPAPKAPVATSAPLREKEEATFEKRVLRPWRSWMEVVERVGRTDSMNASFVKNARAYLTENGDVVVRFKDSFSLSMMESNDARDRLRMAICAVLRRELPDRSLVMEVEGRREDASVIDEILDSTDDSSLI